MTKIVFEDEGYRRLTSDSTLPIVIDHINGLNFKSSVVLNICGCIFNYRLAKIFDTVVNNLERIAGDKSFVIIHGYSIATPNHLTVYLTRDSSLLPQGVKDLDGVKSFLNDNYNIIFDFVEAGDE